MHEAALDNRLVLQHNLVTVTALEALLAPVALVGRVFHLVEVPYHTEFSHCGHEVAFLFTALSYLERNTLGQSDGTLRMSTKLKK